MLGSEGRRSPVRFAVGGVYAAAGAGDQAGAVGRLVRILKARGRALVEVVVNGMRAQVEVDARQLGAAEGCNSG